MMAQSAASTSTEPHKPPPSFNATRNMESTGQVPQGGVLLDDKGRLEYVLWYSAPFEPKDRLLFDIKKAVMFLSVFSGIVLFLACMLFLVGAQWLLAGLALLFLILLPITGYCGASKERRHLVGVYTVCCVCCISIYIAWCTIVVIHLSHYLAQSSEYLAERYGTSTRHYVTAILVSIMMTIVAVGFWAYASYVGYKLYKSIVCKLSRQREDEMRGVELGGRAQSFTQYPYGQYAV